MPNIMFTSLFIPTMDGKEMDIISSLNYQLISGLYNFYLPIVDLNFTNLPKNPRRYIKR